MKFSCDSCGAAYIISDEKIGPTGVKVRCKKCGNQITVKRVEDMVSAPVLERVAPAAPQGLDDELGSAFDQAFGDKPAAPASGPATVPAVTLATAAAAEAPAPAAQEWYVAIGEAQVGPLPLAEVKKRWEAGDIGPDSLVWRPGMGEWGPLSGVPELAAFLAPVPQPRAPVAAPATAVFSAPSTRQVAPQARPAAPAPEVEWKPTGASALAALASEELATRAAATAPAPAAPRSLMEQLPESGGVDPTGVMPLPIKAMERTGEQPMRRSSVARGAQELRHKRTMRTVVLVALLVVVAAIGGAYAYVQLLSRPLAPPAQVAVRPPAPPPAVAPVAAAPTPEPAAANALAAAPVEVAPAVAAPAPAEKAAEAAPRKAKPPPPAARPARPAPAQPPAVAKAAPERPAAEKPAPKKKDGLLDFDQGGEDDLAAALGSGTGGRKVYVPPAAATSAPPDRLSDAQILESVKLHSDDLQRCVAAQRAREPDVSGTIKVAWTIQADGSARDARCVTPEFAQGEFAKCMIGVVRGIRFPRVGDPKGQSVTFPFKF